METHYTYQITSRRDRKWILDGLELKSRFFKLELLVAEDEAKKAPQHGLEWKWLASKVFKIRRKIRDCERLIKQLKMVKGTNHEDNPTYSRSTRKFLKQTV